MAHIPHVLSWKNLIPANSNVKTQPTLLEPFKVLPLSELTQPGRRKETRAIDIYTTLLEGSAITVYQIVSLPTDEYISTGDCVVPMTRTAIRDNPKILDDIMVLLIRRDAIGVTSRPITDFFQPTYNGVTLVGSGSGELTPFTRYDLPSYLAAIDRSDRRVFVQAPISIGETVKNLLLGTIVPLQILGSIPNTDVILGDVFEVVDANYNDIKNVVYTDNTRVVAQIPKTLLVTVDSPLVDMTKQEDMVAPLGIAEPTATYGDTFQNWFRVVDYTLTSTVPIAVAWRDRLTYTSASTTGVAQRCQWFSIRSSPYQTGYTGIHFAEDIHEFLYGRHYMPSSIPASIGNPSMVPQYFYDIKPYSVSKVNVPVRKATITGIPVVVYTAANSSTSKIATLTVVCADLVGSLIVDSVSDGSSVPVKIFELVTNLHSDPHARTSIITVSEKYTDTLIVKFGVDISKASATTVYQAHVRLVNAVGTTSTVINMGIPPA